MAVVLLMLAIVASIVAQSEVKEVSQVGGKINDAAAYAKLIDAAAGRGDYELAGELYENSQVLGAQSRVSGLEFKVYPERKVYMEANVLEEFILNNPASVNILARLSEIYESIEAQIKKEEIDSLIKYLDPQQK